MASLLRLNTVQIMEINESPAFLLLDTDVSHQHRELPLALYESGIALPPYRDPSQDKKNPTSSSPENGVTLNDIEIIPWLYSGFFGDLKL